MPEDKRTFERGADERDYVEECPSGCGAAFIGMTPEDTREHIVEDHGDPLGKIWDFPSEEWRREPDA